jgi:hypothetical protein
MTVCGYDPRMKEGLAVFAEGLVRAVESKAKRLKNNLETQLIAEADQILLLSNFLEGKLKDQKELGNEDPRILGMLGIVYLCRGMLGNLADTSPLSKDFDKGIQSAAALIADTLRTFEDEYEGMPRSSAVVAKMNAGWAAVEAEASAFSTSKGHARAVG